MFWFNKNKGIIIYVVKTAKDSVNTFLKKVNGSYVVSFRNFKRPPFKKKYYK